MLSVFSRNKTASDEEILKEYRNSARIDMLGDLYGRYMDLVFGVCLKYLKRSDLAQDAVIHIFEHVANVLKHKEVDNFRPWLYVVAKNHCLMELRKNKHVTTSMDDEKFYEGRIMEWDYAVHPIDVEEQEKNEEALKVCIEKLKALQKQSIELFYFQELSYQQISMEMKIEVKQVKSYIQNAKRNLKLCLENNAK